MDQQELKVLRHTSQKWWEAEDGSRRWPVKRIGRRICITAFAFQLERESRLVLLREDCIKGPATKAAIAEIDWMWSHPEENDGWRRHFPRMRKLRSNDDRYDYFLTLKYDKFNMRMKVANQPHKEAFNQMLLVISAMENAGGNRSRNDRDLLDEFARIVDEDPDCLPSIKTAVKQLVDAARNYDMLVDLHPGNFSADPQGNLIFLDPLLSRQLIDR